MEQLAQARLDRSASPPLLPTVRNLPNDAESPTLANRPWL